MDDDMKLPMNSPSVVVMSSPEEEKPRRQTCHECHATFTSLASLIAHFTAQPLKSHRSAFETHCPARFATHMKSFVNGPSLETVRVKREWIDLGQQLLQSYPSGVKCSCGKTDWDFGNTNVIARHLVFNPKHQLQVIETEFDGV